MARRSQKAADRGYGLVHRRLRARLLPLVRAGLAECVYCGDVIVGDFDLSHSDDRTRYIGPAHPVCNRREAGLKSVRLGYGRNRTKSDDHALAHNSRRR